MFTRASYARSGDVNIAYQVVGDGPVDLVLVLGWELPALASFLNRLAGFSRLILFDKRGCGMSDRVHPLPTLEQRMDDVRAVMDAAGSERAAVMGIDISGILPTSRVPTLIVHARGDRVAPIEAGRYFAEHIPNARLFELDSIDHWPYFGDADLVLGEIEQFLTGARSAPPPDSMLATILCTDLPQASAHAVWLGDRRWSQLVERHLAVVRRWLRVYAGTEIDAGERGVTAVFDGTARAIRCAIAVRDELLELGLRVRAGVHAGECEVGGGRPRGVPLHLASAVMGAAGAGQVLVSGTVKDLVIGSGLEFADAGVKAFAGVPGTWHVYRAGAEPEPKAPDEVEPLTSREGEVARLLAAGLSNREIAVRLFLSERTVDNHVHHILGKLGFDSRVQVATWLARK